MTTEKSLIDSAIRGWKSNVERADKLCGGLSSEQLAQEVAPGRNRLIYLWGALEAANDGLLPLLGVGERLHPEFDAMFTSNPDKSVPLTVSGPSLKAAWQEIHQKLWDGISKFSAAGLGAAAYRGVGRGFRAGAASKSIHGSAWKNRAPCLSRGAGHLGAAKDRVNCFGIRIARFRRSLKWIRNDSEGISEIKFDRRTESRKEAARIRASRLG